jgi:hypothetical protein
VVSNFTIALDNFIITICNFAIAIGNSIDALEEVKIGARGITVGHSWETRSGTPMMYLELNGGGALGIHLTMYSCLWRIYILVGWHLIG